MSCDFHRIHHAPDNDTQVHMRSRRALKHVAAAKEIYGSDMITGLTVWGHWDSDLYMKHNSDLDPDTDAWEHFKSE